METAVRVTFSLPRGTEVLSSSDSEPLEFMLPGAIRCAVESTFVSPSAFEVREWVNARMGRFTNLAAFRLLVIETLPSSDGTVQAGVGTYRTGRGAPRWVASLVKRFPGGDTIALSAEGRCGADSMHPDLAMLADIAEMAHLG
ncbi:hypothetical protein JT358_12320 [Micrococcales bacterium 31B]|nr:hypothetical protein [Micrococcales bacterium 31B]